jgi:predicted transcriptional regulator
MVWYLGTMTDKELAKKIGVTPQAVHTLRKKLCIASYKWLSNRFGK